MECLWLGVAVGGCEWDIGSDQHQLTLHIAASSDPGQAGGQQTEQIPEGPWRRPLAASSVFSQPYPLTF